MMLRIAIIGGGAIGIGCLIHLIRTFSKLKNTSVEIYIFEKNEFMGNGVAFGSDYDSFVLNTAAEDMSIILGDSNSFVEWLEEHTNDQSRDGFSISSHHYPRSFYGKYLRAMLNKYIQIAQQCGIVVNFIHAEVRHILSDATTDRFLIKFQNKHEKTDLISNISIAILAISNLSTKRFSYLNSNPNFISSPYPSKKLRTITTNARVGILGSRLTAVDAAIALKKCQNHSGPIAFISQSGRIPVVRALRSKMDLKYLQPSQVYRFSADQKNKLTVRYILRLFLREMGSQRGDLLAIVRAQDTLIQFLRSEIEKAKTPRLWQTVFREMNSVIEDIWECLDHSEKWKFRSLYESIFLSLRIPMPLCNAEVLLNLMELGQLSIIQSHDRIEWNGSNFLVVNNSPNRDKFSFDYIIDATGYARYLSEIDNPLINSMQSEGLLSESRLGDIGLDFATSQTLSPQGEINNGMYAIGNLTSGTYLLTSSIPMNLKRIGEVVRHIAKSTQLGNE